MSNALKILSYYGEKKKFTKRFVWSCPISPFKRNNKKGDNTVQKTNIQKSGKNELNEFSKEVENYMVFKDKYIIKKTYRKIKSVVVYNIFKNKGVVMKIFKRMKIKEYKEYMGIGNGNHSRIVGFTPGYIGFRKSTIVRGKNYIIDEIMRSFKQTSLDYPIIYSNLIKSLNNQRLVVTGSPDSNTNHLREFLKNDRKEIFKDEEILKIIDSGKFIKAPFLDFSDPSEIPFVVNYNPDSSNGYMTSKICGSTKKGNSIDVSVMLAIDKYKLVTNFPMKNYCLWELFSREKDFKVDSADEYSSRVVLNCEHYETILLGWIFQKWMVATESFNTSNINFNIKGSFNGIKAKKLIDKSDNYDFYVDADWTFFDASTDSQELRIACALMFSNTLKDDKHKRLIYHVMESLITKYIVLPPGLIVEVNRGNPSGHPGITATNCVVNLVRWSLIGYKIYGYNYSDYMDIDVYGDDALVFFKNHDNLINLDLIIAELGFKSDKILPNMFPCSLIRDAEGPDFLKRRFNNHSLEWNQIKVFDKLIYPSRVRPIEDQIELILNFIVTSPGNYEFNEYLTKLIFEIIRRNPTCNTRMVDIVRVLDGIKFNNFSYDLSENPLRSFNREKSLLGFSCQLLKDEFLQNHILLKSLESNRRGILLSTIIPEYTKLLKPYLLNILLTSQPYSTKEFYSKNTAVYDFNKYIMNCSSSFPRPPPPT